MILFVIQENATSNPRGAVRRHSLLSQTSIKRLFKWKARSFILLRSFLSPNEYLGFKPRLSLLLRSSDPGSRRQSDTNEASSLTNNHYFFSGEEGENNQMIHLSPSRLLFCSRAQPGRGGTLQHHHAVLLRPEQLSPLQSFTQLTNNKHRH